MTAICLASIALDRMAGGIERNMIYLANDLAKDGFKVSLMTFDLMDAREFFPLDPNINWVKVGLSRPHERIGFRQRLALLFRIRRALRTLRVDTLICFHHGILLRFMAAAFFLPVKFVCSERHSLSIYEFIRTKRENTNFAMLKFTDAITVQFDSYRETYPKSLQDRIHAIHNPVFPSAVGDEDRETNILSIGRHATQKRFDVLVDAFALATERAPEWTLTIIGDGPLEPSLRQQVDALGLTNRVTLLPPTSQLDAHFAKARFYCQPSQWEGFPNAQAEAMAAGVIPIGFSNTAGVSDLIQDHVNGYLAPPPATSGTLAETLKNALQTPSQWAQISLAARRVSSDYSVDLWRQKWRTLLNELAA